MFFAGLAGRIRASTQPPQRDPAVPLPTSQDPFGLFYTWWRGDPLPDLPGVSGLSIESVAKDRVSNSGIGIDAQELDERVEQGHRLYLARVASDVAGWGWSATSTASIGELGITIALPPRNRYLWDFVTLPEWRGQGIYPHMLQAILSYEADVDRFWVGHDYSNVASGRGILRSGFQLVGELYPLDEGGFVLCPLDDPERTRLGASILGVSAECEGSSRA